MFMIIFFKLSNFRFSFESLSFELMQGFGDYRACTKCHRTYFNKIMENIFANQTHKNLWHPYNIAIVNHNIYNYILATIKSNNR